MYDTFFGCVHYFKNEIAILGGTNAPWQEKNWEHAATTVDSGFDNTEDFHEDAIFLTKTGVSWCVDQKPIHTKTKFVPDEPLSIRMNASAGNTAASDIQAWLSVVDAALPACAEIDAVDYFPSLCSLWLFSQQVFNRTGDDLSALFCITAGKHHQDRYLSIARFAEGELIAFNNPFGTHT